MSAEGASYQRTQFATMIVIVFTVTLAFMVAIGLASQRLMLYIMAPGVLIMLGLGAAFCCLTISVGNGRVSWAFGPGWIKGHVLLTEIKSVTAVKSGGAGWGIRMINNGTLYNVSGFDAVELVLANGKRIQLGTDEPSVLEAAIRTAVPVSGVRSDAAR